MSPRHSPVVATRRSRRGRAALPGRELRNPAVAEANPGHGGDHRPHAGSRYLWHFVQSTFIDPLLKRSILYPLSFAPENDLVEMAAVPTPCGSWHDTHTT